MQDFENETRGALLRQKAPLPQPCLLYTSAVYEIQMQEAAAEDPDQVNTLQVNDNTLGD